MDDHPGKDPRELLAEVTLHLISTYGLLVKALAGLPIPIELPSLLDGWHTEEIDDSLIRAYYLVAEIPLGSRKRETLRGMLLDWIAAADCLLDAQEAPALWKLDFCVTQLVRIRSRWVTYKAIE
ncbi:hypothetical protein [Spirillospora sp. CA-294931]|uniref:hypothetical protein n=1 Tax=Spirillospora sp. CA-294931 TaxID=3240042 RepID=UPI003D8A4DE2